jgi:hypothetical protein
MMDNCHPGDYAIICVSYCGCSHAYFRRKTASSGQSLVNFPSTLAMTAGGIYGYRRFSGKIMPK